MEAVEVVPERFETSSASIIIFVVRLWGRVGGSSRCLARQLKARMGWLVSLDSTRC